MSEATEVPKAQTEAPPIRFVAQQTVSDLVWRSAELVRRSPFVIAIGTFVISVSAIAVITGDLSGIIGVLLGLSFVTGVFAVPFVLWSVRQRRDLLLAPVTIEIDAEGVTMTQTTATMHAAWSVYRRARETKREFVLDTGAGTSAILLKRAMGPDVVEVVRGLLMRLGLLGAPPSLARRLRPVIWVTVGLAAAALLIGGTAVLATPESNVVPDVTPTVVGRHLSLEGTTDQPDGTILEVQVFQSDAWQRAFASGLDAQMAFDLMRSSQATVQGGHFSAAADMTGWPPGRGVSAVYLWVDDSRPDAVKARFGRDGADLRGPDVYDDEDRGRTLGVDRGFDIPE